MRRKYKRIKKNIGHYVFHLIAIATFISIIFMLTKATVKAYSKYSYAKEKAEYLEKKRILAERRNSDLKQRLRYLKSDRGKEDILRSTYGFVKEGEEVMVIVKEKKQKDKQDEKPLTFWDRIRFNLLR